MIITCDNCRAKYVVARQMIGDSGRNVKCVKCNHVWFATPSPEEDIEGKAAENNKAASNVDASKKADLPAVIESPTLKVVQFSTKFFIFLGFLLGVYYSIDNFFIFQPIKKFVGLNIEEEIQITSAKATTDEGSGSFATEINAVITNKSQTERDLPKIRLQIKDHDHNIMGSYVSDKDVGVLKAGASYNFSDRISNLPGQAAYLTIDIGTALDFMER